MFYIGQAKDRHHKLIQIFKDAISNGLHCLFYITGVPEKEQYTHENIIYNELKARDYEVFTGKTYKGGMDFVVINGRKKCFIQVAY